MLDEVNSAYVFTVTVRLLYNPGMRGEQLTAAVKIHPFVHIASYL